MFKYSQELITESNISARFLLFLPLLLVFILVFVFMIVTPLPLPVAEAVTITSTAMVLMKSSVTSPSKIGTAKNENNPLEKFLKKWRYKLLE